MRIFGWLHSSNVWASKKMLHIPETLLKTYCEVGNVNPLWLQHTTSERNSFFSTLGYRNHTEQGSNDDS
jgi:hypothetical protein